MGIRQGNGRRSPRAARLVGAGVIATAAFLVGGMIGLACGREKAPPGSGPAGTGGAQVAAGTDAAVAKLVVARVGKREITVKDLDTRFRLQFADLKDMTGPAAVKQKWELLLSVFDQALWVAAAEKRGLDKDPEFREQFELSRQFILSRYAQNKLVSDQATPTDGEIQKYYDDNLDKYRQPARAIVQMILVASRAEAEGLRRRAVAGEDFAELARRYSKDESSNSAGGNIAPIGQGTLVQGFPDRLPALNDAIFATAKGQVTSVLETPRGAVFFRVNDRTDARTLSLDDAKPTIVKWLRGSKSNEIHAGILEEVRKESRADVDTAGWIDYSFKVLTMDEVFQLAESERRPERRIRWFTAIAERYPDDPKAAQALFLAAFSYAEDQKNYARAGELFKRMLEKYPNSDLKDSAKWMLENMDKGLENLPYADQVKRRAYGG